MLLKILKWAGIVVGALIVIIVLVLAFLPLNWLRGPINTMVSDKLGREFAIKGDLHGNLLSLTPYISAENIELANAPWSKPPREMIHVDKAEFQVSLPALLSGNIVMPTVTLSHPKIALEINADGKRNWVFNKHKAEHPERPPIPVIKLLTINEGQFTFRDRTHDTNITIHAASFAPSDEHEHYGIKFTGDGQYRGVKFELIGHGGSVLSLQDAAHPYPVSVAVQAGTTHLKADGTVTGAEDAATRRMDMTVSIHGPDLSVFYALMHIPLPPTPPFRLTGHLSHSGHTWRFADFEGHVGDSDLEGDVAYIQRQPRPLLRGHLTSKLLDLEDFGGLVGAQPNTQPGETHAEAVREQQAREAKEPGIVPSTPFHRNRLRAMDADIHFYGEEIRGRQWPFQDLKMHLVLKDGKLTINPANFGVAGGQVVADIMFNSRKDPPHATAHIKLARLALERLFPALPMMENSRGLFGGRAVLDARGDSMDSLLGTMDGQVGFALTDGRINQELIELAGLDIAEFLGLVVIGGDQVPIRCAVGDFKITNGVMKTKVLVFDTTDTVIYAGGTINLGREKLDVTVRPRPKDVSIAAVRGPIHIGGTFKSPSIQPSEETIVRGAAAIALAAAIGPLAALVPLIETGPGHNSNCQGLIKKARSAVRNATPSSR
ncbi:MAG TPA: AsmA family protein [Gammaproteobacteria bacterium]|nr:AsmA family protein [Gammaproteobacteria bacterium]